MTSFHPYWQGSSGVNNIFYAVDGQQTLSKVQALILANGNLSRVTHHYLEDVWDQCNWTIEPSDSIQCMVDQRCQQIRQQHDYVALWFSGGYDSQTILDSFVRQGLVIDELLTYKRNYFLHWSATAEQNAALSQAHQLKQTVWPNLVIKEIFYTPEILIDYYRQYGDNWIMRPAFQATLSKADRPFLYNHNPAFRKTLNHPRRADIEGREKPRLLIENGWWHAVWLDVTSSEYQMDSRSLQFFTTADMPELEIKQAWLMINWLESQPFLDQESLSTHLHALQSYQLGSRVYEQWNTALGRSAVRNIGSYVTATNGTKMWYNGNVTDVLESRDLKDYFQRHCPDVWKIYSNGIDQVKQIAPAMFDEHNRIRPIISKRYPIKPVEPSRLFQK